MIEGACSTSTELASAEAPEPDVSALTGGISSAGREADLVAAVREVLGCLGTPDGYLGPIGEPITRRLQAAFEAYEPHPKPNWIR